MRDTRLSWQKILADGFCDVELLLKFLNLPNNIGSNLSQKEFATRVPKRFASLMEKGNPNDPLLLQVLPVAEELKINPNFSFDPLKEHQVNPVTGLLHKYYGRVLLTFGSCAVNCRYCFRRHFSYKNNSPFSNNWQDIIKYIQNDTSINEVILSGGDALLTKDKQLEILFDKLNAISHLTTLRIHTRVPIVLPERIDDGFIKALNSLKLQKVMVLHCNHVNEIDSTVIQALKLLKQNSVFLLNQSVLLKGINDSSDTLSLLSKKLFSLEVLPYYLHILDKVQGTSHFEISLKKAKQIYNELQSKLPGYLVPKLVMEEPGKLHKTLITLN